MEQELLSLWQVLCLWYRNVILTIKMLDLFYLCFVTLFSLVNWKYLVLFDCFLDQKLLSMWQALCLWHWNVNLTIKNVRLILFGFSSRYLFWSFESIMYCLTVFWNKNCCQCDKRNVFDTEMSFRPWKMFNRFYLWFFTLFSLVIWKYYVPFDCFLEQKQLSMWKPLCLW